MHVPQFLQRKEGYRLQIISERCPEPFDLNAIHAGRSSLLPFESCKTSHQPQKGKCTVKEDRLGEYHEME
jgi:hypothetical protein